MSKVHMNRFFIHDKPKFQRSALLILDCCLAALSVLVLATAASAQTPDAMPPNQSQGAPAGEGRGPGRGGTMGGRGTVGKITAMTNGTIEVTKPDGTRVLVKLSANTEFRKDRQPAALTDFKVGDFVMVRGPENSDHTVNAEMIGGRSANAGGGNGGARFGSGGWTGGQAGPGGPPMGELGKDYVSGEVKSIDPPKLTVLRSDNVTQTLVLNEDTSLRKGRESITMADIHPGDHVMIRGASQNNVFEPKNAMVLSPEQWERMQQNRARSAPAVNAPANSPPTLAPTSNPPQR
jgi:Domain of unknown function (DUF5666)